MLEDPDFQSDYDAQEKELKKLRKKIKKGETPDWIIDALEEMHATYPEGQSLRYRSSTNNEDLPRLQRRWAVRLQDPGPGGDGGGRHRQVHQRGVGQPVELPGIH